MTTEPRLSAEELDRLEAEVRADSPTNVFPNSLLIALIAQGRRASSPQEQGEKIGPYYVEAIQAEDDTQPTWIVWDQDPTNQSFVHQAASKAEAVGWLAGKLADFHGSEPIKQAVSIMTDAAGLLDVIKGEWGASWSEWDQGVRDRLSSFLFSHARVDALTAAPRSPALPVEAGEGPTNENIGTLFRMIENVGEDVSVREIWDWVAIRALPPTPGPVAELIAEAERRIQGATFYGGKGTPRNMSNMDMIAGLVSALRSVGQEGVAAGSVAESASVGGDDVPSDVAALVVAARLCMDEDYDAASRRRLDQAAEAFASRVAWDDEPDEDIASVAEADHQITDDGWPHDNWNHDAGRFVALLMKHVGWWWGMDFPLKYLTLRIDTRDGGFVLRDKDGAAIPPSRVLAAIEKHYAAFPDTRPPEETEPQATVAREELPDPIPPAGSASPGVGEGESEVLIESEIAEEEAFNNSQFGAGA